MPDFEKVDSIDASEFAKGGTDFKGDNLNEEYEDFQELDLQNLEELEPSFAALEGEDEEEERIRQEMDASENMG